MSLNNKKANKKNTSVILNDVPISLGLTGKGHKFVGCVDVETDIDLWVLDETETNG